MLPSPGVTANGVADVLVNQAGQSIVCHDVRTLVVVDLSAPLHPGVAGEAGGVTFLVFRNRPPPRVMFLRVRVLPPDRVLELDPRRHYGGKLVLRQRQTVPRDPERT